MDIAGCPRKRINTAGTWKWKSRVLTQKKLVRSIKGLRYVSSVIVLSSIVISQAVK